MKRLLALVLAIIMVMSCAVVVSAETTNVMELDKIYTAEFNDDSNEELVYSFTPSETDAYVIESVSIEDENGYMPDPYVSVKDAEGNILFDSDDTDLGYDFFCVCSLTKNVTYTIEIDSYENGIFDFCIYKADVSDDFSIVEIGKTKFTVGTNHYFDIKNNDENGSVVMGDWSVSDSEIASIEDTSTNNFDGGWCEVFFKQSGTFTLTFTSESGVSDSIEVTVVEPEELKLDNKFNFNMLPGQYKIIKFVPEESGYYTIYSQCDYDVDANLYLYEESIDDYVNINSDEDSGNGMNFNIVEYLEAGKEYYISIEVYNIERCVLVSVFVEKAKAATSIDISDADDLVVQVGNSFKIDAILSPENSNTILEWSVSDSNILSYSDSEYNNGRTTAYFECLEEGSVTITATTAAGLSDSATVTVVPAFVLEEDVPYTANLSNHQYKYTFTPDSSGTYKFYSLNGYAIYSSLHDDNENFLDSAYAADGKAMVIEYDLDAGVTYNLYVDIEDYGCNLVTVCVSKEEGTANRIDINLDDEITYSAGSNVYVDFQSYPVKAAFDEYYTWHSTDEAVAYVNGGTLYFVSEGSATITVEAENGLTDSIEVTVTETTELFANQKNNVECKYNEELCYSFVPKISGRYVVFSKSVDGFDYDYNDPAVGIYDSEGSFVCNSDDNPSYIYDFKAEADFVAGETYYIYYSSYGPVSKAEMCIQCLDNELGDITGDGSVNQLDTTILRRSLVGVVPNIMTNIADINEDGSVNQLDVTLLRRSLVA